MMDLFRTAPYGAGAAESEDEDAQIRHGRGRQPGVQRPDPVHAITAIRHRDQQPPHPHGEPAADADGIQQTRRRRLVFILVRNRRHRPSSPCILPCRGRRQDARPGTIGYGVLRRFQARLRPHKSREVNRAVYRAENSGRKRLARKEFVIQDRVLERGVARSNYAP